MQVLSDHMGFTKEQSAGFLANHMARLFARELQARIRPLGLSLGAFPALLELWEGDGLTQKELTARLDIEQATMANTLARMERDGLVTRRKDHTDGRAQRIYLTEKARAARRPALAAAEEVNRIALAGLSAEAQQQFIETMQDIVAGFRDGRDP